MDLAYELHDLVLTLDRHADKLLAEFGLNYNRYVALVIIGEHPGLTGRILAGALRISEPSTSAIVKRLLRDGLVVDVAPAGSGNIRRLEATEAGHTLRESASSALGSSLDRAATSIGLDPEALAATVHALHAAVRKSPATQDR